MTASQWWLSKAEWVWAGDGGNTVASIACHINCACCNVSASQWVMWGHRCDVKLRGQAVPEEPDRALFASRSNTHIHTQMERDRWKCLWCWITALCTNARFDWNKVKNPFYLCLTCKMNVKHGSLCLLCSLYDRNLPLKCNCLLTSQDNYQSNGKSFKWIVYKVIQVGFLG